MLSLVKLFILGNFKLLVQDMTDDLQTSALDVEHLPYDQVFIIRVIKGAKFCQGHANERMR